ncbi:serine/threonine protein kinase [Waterburya agarophytonicola K14]|uniref:non-specific serine/threonine protein kinase n=1 Tax=Waterburya agarophytonicola KI4 TaxID=2874699 RepID=A0A964FEW2_9CYAN|nr:serine/threonine-protein kinase [Waterburya agarophytonicola]MCC0176321.1 serine/threonine protein kinase [Waterburya agarophytonicola KI4]
MSLCINPRCEKSENSDTMLFCQSCHSELLIDGRYRVQRLVGQGGFGLTYEVLDLNSRPKVLKVLTDNHPKYVELFQQEARVLEIMDHPGIPKIDLNGYFTYYLQGIPEPLHCIAMEKIEGLDLEEYLAQRGNKPISHKRALRWLAELSLILEQVHKFNFFHRDIKPSNIMLKANGCLVLIDFGTARQVSDTYIHKQSEGLITGIVSSGYTPIEQMRGKAVKQSDFYALGGTMIFLLTACNPLDFYNSFADKFEWSQAVENVSPKFVNLIDSMVSSFPADRPQNARDIFQEIVKIDSSLQSVENYWIEPSKNSSSQVTSSFSQIPVASYNINYSAQPKPIDRRIPSDFVDRCRHELAEFIGPMAGIICNQTLSNNPGLSSSEFVLALATKISDSQDAQKFKQHLL